MNNKTKLNLGSLGYNLSGYRVRCDICGNLIIKLHCKLKCNFCGYSRDCSDP